MIHSAIFGTKRDGRAAFQRAAANAWLLLAIVFLALGAPFSRAEFEFLKSKSKSKDAQAATTARLKEIDQATKGFADRYVTYLVDSCDKVEIDNPDPEARKQALRLKLFTSNSIYGIASSPNPLGQLLDLCVVVTLQKINWVEEGRAKKVLGANHSAGVIQTFNNAYTEVWELAARFLTPNEIAEIKKLVRQWRVSHKDIALLPYVRFDDFAKARAGVEQQNPVVNGLFAQISEANRSIQTATDFGERALFFTERMPRLLQWQTERTVQAVLDNPDLQQTLSTIDQISKTITDEVAKFDEQEIQAQKTLEALNQVTLNGRPLMMEARQTGETLKQTGESLTDTFNAFDRLMHTLNPPLPPGEKPKPEGKPFDIMEYGTVFDKATAMAHEARLFMDTSIQLESAPEFNNRIADIESFTQRRTDHITMRAAQLIGFFFATLFLYRWLCARCIGPKRAEGGPSSSSPASPKA